MDLWAWNQWKHVRIQSRSTRMLLIVCVLSGCRQCRPSFGPCPSCVGFLGSRQPKKRKVFIRSAGVSSNLPLSRLSVLLRRIGPLCWEPRRYNDVTQQSVCCSKALADGCCVLLLSALHLSVFTSQNKRPDDGSGEPFVFNKGARRRIGFSPRTVSDGVWKKKPRWTATPAHRPSRPMSLCPGII